MEDALISYFGTDPGDLTADEMHGRTPDPAPRPSEGDETEIAPLTTVQRSVLAGIARECLEAFAETRRRFPEATLSSEITLAQRCRDILRYEATIRELEARRSPSVPTAIQEQRDAGEADATYWRDKAKHMAALMAMAGATLCEPVSTANIRDAKKSCDIGVHVMREIIEDEKRVPSSRGSSQQRHLHVSTFERIISEMGCRVIHSDYPRGTSCVDVARIAKSNPDGYSPKFRDSILAGETLCGPCRIRVLSRKALLGSDTGLEITDVLLEADAVPVSASEPR